MLYLHPLFQSLMFILCLYAFYLGFARFKSLHLHQKAKFQRKRHALFGLIGLAGFLGGMAGGSIIGGIYKLDPLIGELHEAAGAVMAVLMIFALATGLIQYLKPKPRKLMPALHALANLIVLILFFVQVYSGVGILNRAA
ncbi:DUF4079 family protein [Desulfatibacillum aliphaticivorans]|uniref:DUF4079 family protein n=1 Tax=Desulfatibacillum aliphaticivorans TaxID=218208 RepID=UPI000421F978|nr:DUF4079 family protein [Desulfatibacillum aliphaticivorans]